MGRVADTLREVLKSMRKKSDVQRFLVALTRAFVRAASPGLRTLLEALSNQIDRLERALDRLYEDAFIDTDRPTPSIDRVHPAQARSGDQLDVVVTGSGFSASAVARLTRPGFPDIWSSVVTVENAATAILSLNLSGASPGSWDVEIVNPEGSSATLPGAFLILSAG